MNERSTNKALASTSLQRFESKKRIQEIDAINRARPIGEASSSEPLNVIFQLSYFLLNGNGGLRIENIRHAQAFHKMCRVGQTGGGGQPCYKSQKMIRGIILRVIFWGRRDKTFKQKPANTYNETARDKIVIGFF